MTDAKHIDDGGPAFPSPVSKGVSLRDYFAAKAIINLPIVCENDDLEKGETFVQHIARAAYDIADHMLEARRRKPE